MANGQEVRNDRVAEALAEWAGRKDAQLFADVLRRCLTGHLLLDITDSAIADPAKGPQSGDTLRVRVQTDNAGKRLLVAFTTNQALATWLGKPGISMVQPAASVLAQAIRDEEGVVIDPGGPGVFIAYADEIRQELTDEPEQVAPLSRATTAGTPSIEEYVRLLAGGPLFTPFEVLRDDRGAQTGISVPSGTGPDGKAWAIVGTSPAEVFAWSPTMGAHRDDLEHIVGAVVARDQAGIVVNPMGPAVTVPVDVLRQVGGGEAPSA